MKIQTPNEFLTFCDGLLSLYAIEKNRVGECIAGGIHFGNRSISYKRLYAARAATSKIDKIVQIPYSPSISQRIATGHVAVIIGTERFDVDSVQTLQNTSPPAQVLTLVRVGIVKDGDITDG